MSAILTAPVENCYNTGSLSAKQDRTNNKGIGGIAGQIHAPAIVRNVYNVGSVIGPEAGIGGIAGVLKGTLQNAYFLERHRFKRRFFHGRNSDGGVCIKNS